MGLACHANAAGVVGVVKQRPVTRQTRHKVGKAALDALDIAIDIQVVGLDVVQKHKGGMKVQEAAVILAALHHKVWSAAPARAGLKVQGLAADNPARALAAQNLREHGGRAGLAVCSRHADVGAAARQLAQGLGVLHDAEASLPGLVQLRVAGTHRGRGHHEVDMSGQVLGPLADGHTGALFLQRLRNRRCLQVRAADTGARFKRDARQPADTRTADADEMNGLVGEFHVGLRVCASRCSAALQAARLMGSSARAAGALKPKSARARSRMRAVASGEAMSLAPAARFSLALARIT
ncbi:MAG: hypothetical protein HPKKFMNG_02455 [Planctomycetes bacterium]|nr:hypothetical protein [Planctomycetota bacterium]